MTQVYRPHADWAREDWQERAKKAEQRVTQLEGQLDNTQGAYERLVELLKTRSDAPGLKRRVEELAQLTDIDTAVAAVYAIEQAGR